MGEVWTCRDRELRRDVAVKFLMAGWIRSQPTAVRQDGSVPICVLGPLTEQEHADLVAALSRHGGNRWRPEIGYLDGAV